MNCPTENLRMERLPLHHPGSSVDHLPLMQPRGLTAAAAADPGIASVTYSLARPMGSGGGSPFVSPDAN